MSNTRNTGNATVKSFASMMGKLWIVSSEVYPDYRDIPL